jgi:hypothetical protein
VDVFFDSNGSDIRNDMQFVLRVREAALVAAPLGRETQLTDKAWRIKRVIKWHPLIDT